MNQQEFPVTEKEAKKNGLRFSSEENRNAPFPSRLRNLREQRGISQSRLAEEIGVSKSTVGLWETGDTLPDAKSVYKLCQCYHVSADYLLGLSGHPSENADVRALHDVYGLSSAAASELWTLRIHYQKRLGALSKIMENQAGFRSLLDAIDFCMRFAEWPTYFQQAVENAGMAVEHNLSLLLNQDRAINRSAAIYEPQFIMGKIAEALVEESERKKATSDTEKVESGD